MPRHSRPKPDAPYPPGWEPFLAAINANLDDDTPRVVFADWLQENGDEPRAEFIRLQCAAARGEPGAEKADAILAEHRERWLLGLPKGVQKRPEWCVFRRGFITSITVLGHHWLAKSIFDKNPDAGGKAIRKLTALEELRVEQVWSSVLERDTLTGLRSLIVPSAGSGVFEALTRSPILPSLRDLAIIAKSSDGTSQRSLRHFFESLKHTQLRRLRFQSMHVGNFVAGCLADSRLTGLEELHLCHLSLDAIGAEALARSPALTTLRVLDLLNNPIGDAGLRLLLSSHGLRTLEELGLRECQLTSASVPALAEWEGLRTIRKLDLRHNRMPVSAEREIRSSRHAINLVEILGV